MSGGDLALASPCLAVLEQTLDEQHPGWSEDTQLIARARALSEGFTAEDARTTPALDPLTSAAYLAYFAPRTIAAMSSVLAGLPASGRVVDMGAGSGAASLVLAAAGAEELLLLDRDPRALEGARALVQRLAPDIRVDGRAIDLLRDTATSSARTVVAAFAVSELTASPDDAWTRLRAVAPAANRVLLLDAGDRRRARLVQEVRSVALQDGWHVRAPCPHAEECPALARKRDWCHARAPRHLPPPFARFAEATGRDPGFLAFSYLDLVREPPEHAADGARVIGEPLAEKGRVRVGVCGKGGLRFLQALKRHPDALHALAAVPRGALLDITDLSVRHDTAHLEDARALRVIDEDPR